jgi:polyisoprenoid-binding protein YceI
MKLKQIIASSTIIAALTLVANWNVDTANAKISFSVKGPFGTVHGTFTGLNATIKFDEKDVAGSSISASVDAKTVSTGVGLRNHDLRTEEEWLDTDKYPQISFTSKKIEKTDNGYKAMGELTLKVTHMR